jgi:hypothetical protein
MAKAENGAKPAPKKDQAKKKTTGKKSAKPAPKKDQAKKKTTGKKIASGDKIKVESEAQAWERSESIACAADESTQ